jgi:hypothetical protein
MTKAALCRVEKGTIMWFRRKPKEKSSYLYTFERVGTRPLARQPLIVTADGDTTIDELLKSLTIAHGTGYADDCKTALIRIINVDKPKAWAGGA